MSDTVSSDVRPRRHVELRLVFGILVIIIGLVILAVPVVTEVMVAERARENIARIETVYEAMDDELHVESVEQARMYNDRMHGIEPPEGVEIWDYDEQLRYNHEPSSMMSWIEIPKVGSHLPVYHHTTESVLMAGVGHIDTTNLPVGGEGNLCALSGHSGMPNARMFDDIHSLVEGDVFVLWTLREPYAYRVFDVRVVEPDDTGCLEPQPGRDIVALVTCTPINVNSHRLIVYGERCEYEPDSADMRQSIESVASRRTVPLFAGVGVVLLLVLLLVVRMVRSRRASD